MIFIKNKKAWKELVRSSENDSFPEEVPREYPFYDYIERVDLDHSNFHAYLYKSDLESMIQKIDSGREF